MDGLQELLQNKRDASAHYQHASSEVQRRGGLVQLFEKEMERLKRNITKFSQHPNVVKEKKILSVIEACLPEAREQFEQAAADFRCAEKKLAIACRSLANFVEANPVVFVHLLSMVEVLGADWRGKQFHQTAYSVIERSKDLNAIFRLIEQLVGKLPFDMDFVQESIPFAAAMFTTKICLCRKILCELIAVPLVSDLKSFSPPNWREYFEIWTHTAESFELPENYYYYRPSQHRDVFLSYAKPLVPPKISNPQSDDEYARKCAVRRAAYGYRQSEEWLCAASALGLNPSNIGEHTTDRVTYMISRFSQIHQLVTETYRAGCQESSLLPFRMALKTRNFTLDGEHRLQNILAFPFLCKMLPELAEMDLSFVRKIWPKLTDDRLQKHLKDNKLWGTLLGLSVDHIKRSSNHIAYCGLVVNFQLETTRRARELLMSCGKNHEIVVETINMIKKVIAIQVLSFDL